MVKLLRRSALSTAARFIIAAAWAVARPSAALIAMTAELAGLFVVCVGLWMVWPPVALVVGGGLLVFLAQGVRKNDAPQ